MRPTNGFFSCYREHVLDNGLHPCFSKKPKNKFVFLTLMAMANYKKTTSLNIGEVITSYNEIAKETGYTYAEVRWCVASLIKHKILLKKERQTGLYLKILVGVGSATSTTDQQQTQQQTQQQGANSALDKIIGDISNLKTGGVTDLTTLLTHLLQQGSDNVCNNIRSNIINDPAVDQETPDSKTSSKKEKNFKNSEKKSSSIHQSIPQDSEPIYDQNGSYYNEPFQSHDGIPDFDDDLMDDYSLGNVKNLNLFDKNSVLHEYNREISKIVGTVNKIEREKLQSIATQNCLDSQTIEVLLLRFSKHLDNGLKCKDRAAYFAKMMENTKNDKKAHSVKDRTHSSDVFKVTNETIFKNKKTGEKCKNTLAPYHLHLIPNPFGGWYTREEDWEDYEKYIQIRREETGKEEIKGYNPNENPKLHSWDDVKKDYEIYKLNENSIIEG